MNTFIFKGESGYIFGYLCKRIKKRGISLSIGVGHFCNNFIVQFGRSESSLHTKCNSIWNYIVPILYYNSSIHLLQFLINILSTLFRNKRFMLDEMFQWNASKFAILLEYENPCSFFHFSFSETLYFYLMNTLVYVDIDQGIH